MRVTSLAVSAMALGFATSGVASAQTTQVPAPAQSVAWSAEEAFMLAELKSQLTEQAQAPITSEQGIAALLGVVKDPISVSVANYTATDDGHVAEGVKLFWADEIEDGIPVELGVEIGSMSVFGMDMDAFNALSAGASGQIAERIELRDVKFYGLETLMDAAASEAAELDEDVDFSIDAYDLSSDLIIIENFEWHPASDAVLNALDQYSLEDLETIYEDDFSALWAFVGPYAKVMRNMSFSNMIFSDTDFEFDFAFSEDGMDQSFAFNGSIPLLAYQGYDRGDSALSVVEGMTYAYDLVMFDPEISDTDSVTMSFTGGADLYVWKDQKLSKVLSYLEKAEIPPLSDAENLMSFGTGAIYGEEVRLGDDLFYSTEKVTFDLSEWHWLIPERAAFNADRITYNLENYINYIVDIMSTVEGADEELAEVQDVIDGVMATMEENGVNELVMDFDLGMGWNADTGATDFGYTHTMDGFGVSGLSFAGKLPSFDPLAELISKGEDMDESAMEALWMNDSAISSFNLFIDDDGGIDTLFAIAVAVAKLDEDNPDLAMLRSSTPEQLRTMASAITRMGGMQAAEVFPPAVAYVNSFADFLQFGGKIEADMSPAEPITAESQGAIMQLMADPDALVEFLGLSVTHTAPATDATE